MIIDILSNFFCSFAGTWGFLVLFNVPRKYYLSGCLTGVAGWFMYLFLTETMGATAAMATFGGSFVIVLISRLLAVRMRCPITIFLIAGIIPLVPGAGVYYTAYYLMTGELSLALDKGMGAIKVAFAIVLGIVFVLAIPRQYFQIGYWKQWRILRVPSKLKGVVDGIVGIKS